MNGNGKCPIWGTTATDNAGQESGHYVTSLRAGGKYFIDDITAGPTLTSATAREKVLLTTWLIEQRRLGTSCPRITGALFDDVKKMKLPSVHKRAESLLLYLNRQSELKNKLIGYPHTFDLRNDPEKRHNTTNEFLAWTSSQETSEITYLIQYCQQGNWIAYGTQLTENSFKNGQVLDTLTLKPAGYARLEKLDGANPDSAQGFIAMWFDPSMKKNQEEGFERAIENSGYRPLCINKKETINKIDDEIIAEIRRSRFVVADFTSEPDKPRGGVYYEAGFAQGLNIPVIWTCHEDNIDHVHFDTRQFNHIVWETADDLREKLEKRIGAVIGDGPLK